MNGILKSKVCSAIIISVILSSSSYASYIESRFDGIEKQKYDSTCGVASLSSILKHNFSIEKNELELLNYFELKPEYSFLDLALVAEKFGINTIGVKVTSSQLNEIRSPTILYLKRFGKGHFVILKGIDDLWVQIEDPAWGNLNYTRNQFNRYWLQPDGMGRALIFITKSDLQINMDKIYQKIVPII